MRSWTIFVVAIAACAALMSCATAPKPYHPQPSDHSKMEAKHLYFAVADALANNAGEILAAYMAEEVMYMQKDQEKPDLLSGSQAVERLGDLGGVEQISEEILEIKSRQELQGMGDECPARLKILSDVLKDSDILVLGGVKVSPAGEASPAEKLTLVFRKTDGRVFLTAVMTD